MAKKERGEQVAAQRFDDVPQADQRFWRDVEHLHRLRPRATGEFLIEIGAAHLLRFDIEERLERYGRLDPVTVQRLGADRPPPIPVHAVSVS